MRTNFRNYKNVFALSVDRLGGNLLRPALAVHLCRVNQATGTRLPSGDVAGFMVGLNVPF